MTAALLTLADSRLPAGGHTHSGGGEQAVAAGVVHDPRSLEVYLRRRLVTSGAVAAGVAAAVVRWGAPPVGVSTRRRAWALLDVETDARTPAPALRRASRQQGRGLVRVGRRAWPAAVWDDLPDHPHHPVALGAAAVAAGLTADDAAQAAAYLAITGSATAAQRLLAMDPITVATVTARLAPEVDAVASRGAAAVPVPADLGAAGAVAVREHAGERDEGRGPDERRGLDVGGVLHDVAWLPADTDPLLDLLAEVHADRGDRYFAS